MNAQSTLHPLTFPADNDRETDELLRDLRNIGMRLRQVVLTEQARLESKIELEKIGEVL